MTDIDFDELDKAVTSLMSKPASQNDDGSDDSSAQQIKTLDIGGSLQPDEAPAFDKIGEVAQKIGGEALVTDSEQQASTVNNLDENAAINSVDTSPSVAVTNPGNAEAVSPAPPSVLPQTSPMPANPVAMRPPGGGRFMDVVHPSSDMRSASTPNLVIPNRQSPSVESQIDPQSPVVIPATPVPPPQEPIGTNVMPTSPAAVGEPTEQAAQQPNSPFLPNPNIEKRPLGGPVQMSDDSLPDASTSLVGESDEPKQDVGGTRLINGEVQQGGEKEHDAQRPANPTDFDKPVTPEEQMLQGIESKEVTETDTPGVINNVESGDTERLTNVKPWKEKKKEVTSKTHDMYAMDSQQKPSGPAKRKSGLKIVIIIVIIVVCALLGAGAYFVLGIGK